MQLCGQAVSILPAPEPQQQRSSPAAFPPAGFLPPAPLCSAQHRPCKFSRSLPVADCNVISPAQPLP